MIGYKVVSVQGTGTRKEYKSAAKLKAPYDTIYIPGKFVSNRYPLWYYPTLKEALVAASNSQLRPNIQIWRCEVLETQKMLRNCHFDPDAINLFWSLINKGIKTLEKLKSASNKCYFTHLILDKGYTRVAKQIKLIAPVTDISYSFDLTKINRKKSG